METELISKYTVSWDEIRARVAELPAIPFRKIREFILTAKPMGDKIKMRLIGFKGLRKVTLPCGYFVEIAWHYGSNQWVGEWNRPTAPIMRHSKNWGQVYHVSRKEVFRKLRFEIMKNRDPAFEKVVERIIPRQYPYFYDIERRNQEYNRIFDTIKNTPIILPEMTGIFRGIK